MATNKTRNPRIPRCDQCQMLNISGVNCHEHGCPNAHKPWNPEEQAWERDDRWDEDNAILDDLDPDGHQTALDDR